MERFYQESYKEYRAPYNGRAESRKWVRRSSVIFGTRHTSNFCGCSVAGQGNGSFMPKTYCGLYSFSSA
ncbi:hypothetical protein BLNAU_534 [Blattamonas nauphoetae]|uniref:Uncharacterized protein n=1 Tax=Blattamonas nauphoetae TaxID=2049346 RepID=A0ABQ9YLJ1_9EUKA|nr:hypothetical protein BLNAU_534 [Blattamonas nauphoetae]